MHARTHTSFSAFTLPQLSLYFFVHLLTCAVVSSLLQAKTLVPSTPTLIFRSTGNQRGDCLPILAIVHAYCILQLAVFFFCPFAFMCGRLVALAGQGTVPSIQTLLFRSTRNQRGNCSPILAIVLLYCILQLAVFFFCPSTHMCGHLVALGVQGTVPSFITLLFCSTRKQLGNSSPIFAIVLLYCIV
jgi:hypothetical protein